MHGASLSILDQTGDESSEDEASSSNSEDEAKADAIAKDDGVDADTYFAEEREGWKG